ncbi:MAG: putative rane protein [Frondihabitans sp.]|nr:putative rane protein [Frondihabitans sp.]
MPNNDAILLESVKTHRARLRGAFLIGELAERRDVNDNARRLIGSMVLTAVICAGCVGTSFVLNALNSSSATSSSTTSSSTTTTPTAVSTK